MHILRFKHFRAVYYRDLFVGVFSFILCSHASCVSALKFPEGVFTIWLVQYCTYMLSCHLWNFHVVNITCGPRYRCIALCLQRLKRGPIINLTLVSLLHTLQHTQKNHQNRSSRYRVLGRQTNNNSFLCNESKNLQFYLIISIVELEQTFRM